MVLRKELLFKVENDDDDGNVDDDDDGAVDDVDDVDDDDGS